MENDPLLTPPQDMEFSICFVVFFLKASLNYLLDFMIQKAQTFITICHFYSVSKFWFDLDPSSPSLVNVFKSFFF